MELLAFWLSILGFTSLFGTFILSFIAQKRDPEEFRSQYLWYVAISWIWFALQFLGFIELTLLHNPQDAVIAVIGISRSILSVLITYRITALLISIDTGTVGRRQKLYGVLLSMLVGILIIAVILVENGVVAYLVSLLVNGCFGGFFLIYWLKVRNREGDFRSERMSSFLVLSAIAYLMVGLYTVLFLFFPRFYRPVYDTLATALFILVWCVNDVAIYVREMSRQENPEREKESVDPLTMYGLTPREQEIARHVVTGLSYKEIADVLNISPRTVETHVYRVFKKCSVANKMELGGKLFQFRTNT